MLKLLKGWKGGLKMCYTILSQMVIIMQKTTQISIFKTDYLFLAAVTWDLMGWHGRIPREAYGVSLAWGYDS